MKDQFKVCGIIQKRFTKNKSTPGGPAKESTKSVSALNSHERQKSKDSELGSKERDKDQKRTAKDRSTAMRYPQRNQSQDQRVDDRTNSVTKASLHMKTKSESIRQFGSPEPVSEPGKFSQVTGAMGLRIGSKSN